MGYFFEPIIMERIIKAAKYYLNYQGMRGTESQIQKLLKRHSSEQILHMAKERGF
jgi:hypothetical protein